MIGHSYGSGILKHKTDYQDYFYLLYVTCIHFFYIFKIRRKMCITPTVVTKTMENT